MRGNAVFVVALEGQIVAVADDHARAHALRDKVKQGAGVYFGIRYEDGRVIYEDDGPGMGVGCSLDATHRIWP